MKQRIFNTLATMSLLLLIAVVALWVRSHWVVDEINHETNRSASSAWGCSVVGLESWNGCVEIVCVHMRTGADQLVDWQGDRQPAGYPSDFTDLGANHLLNWSRQPMRDYIGPENDLPSYIRNFMPFHATDSVWVGHGNGPAVGRAGFVSQHYGCPDLFLATFLGIASGLWLLAFLRRRQKMQPSRTLTLRGLWLRSPRYARSLSRMRHSGGRELGNFKLHLTGRFDLR